MADTPVPATDAPGPAAAESSERRDGMTDETWRTGADDATGPSDRTSSGDQTSTGDRTDAGDRTSPDDRRSTSDQAGRSHPPGRGDPAVTPVLTAAMSSVSTKFVSTTEFRAGLSELLELANRQPVTVASRGARPRAVLVSPDFFDRACDALGEEPYARPPRSRLEEIMAENLQILEFL
jgi:prevent-host-death family protein